MEFPVLGAWVPGEEEWVEKGLQKQVVDSEVWKMSVDPPVGMVHPLMAELNSETETYQLHSNDPIFTLSKPGLLTRFCERTVGGFPARIRVNNRTTSLIFALGEALMLNISGRLRFTDEYAIIRKKTIFRLHPAKFF